MDIIIQEHRILRSKQTESEVEVILKAKIADPEKADAFYKALQKAYHSVQTNIDEVS